jgi:hypothetical protein
MFNSHNKTKIVPGHWYAFDCDGCDYADDPKVYVYDSDSNFLFKAENEKLAKQIVAEHNMHKPLVCALVSARQGMVKDHIACDMIDEVIKATNKIPVDF